MPVEMGSYGRVDTPHLNPPPQGWGESRVVVSQRAGTLLVWCPNDGFTGTRDHIVIPAKAGIQPGPSAEGWIPDQVRNDGHCEAVAETLH
jgi:hypothetical protein